MGSGDTLPTGRQRQPRRRLLDDQLSREVVEGPINPSSLEKVAALELSLSRAHGAFELFGVVLRESLLDLWDLVVSAPWLEPGKIESYKLMTGALQAALTCDEFLQFSRVVILEKGNPFLERMLALVSCEHGLQKLRDTSVESIPIRIAYILTAKRRRARKQFRRRDRSEVDP